MSSRRIKFIWGSSDQIKGRWYLGLVGRYDRGDGRREALALSVRGGLCWLGAVTLAGYLAAVTALFFWFERRPANLITYADTLLLPVRWSHVRELRGRMMIEEGVADMAVQRWAEGSMKLRVGLARDPHNLRGRQALAQFYQLANRRTHALAVLTEDLAHGYPGRPYLKGLFALAAQGEDYAVILAACDRFIPQATDDRSWLVAQRIQALIGAHRSADALRAAEAAEESAAVREARVLALCELGRSPEALDVLDRWPAESAPAARATILRLRVRALREAGQLAAMDAAWARLRELEPASPPTYIFGVVQKSLAHQKTEAAEALEEYFRRFSASAPNLLLAAHALAEARDAVLVRRCAERAAQQGFSKKAFGLVLLEAELVAGDGANAVRTLAELKPQLVRAEPGERHLAIWLERLLAVAMRTEESHQAPLLDFLQQRPTPMRVFRQTIEALVAAGRYAPAREVLELAERSYPSSPTLAEFRGRLDEALKPAVTPPAAATVVAAAPLLELGSIARLEALAGESRWGETAQVVREIRIARPAWLAARDAEILDWQMRAATHTGDTLELLGATKLYLDGSRDRALRIVALARELGEKGMRDTGALLLNEVLRSNAGFPPALRLHKEWLPKTSAQQSLSND